MRRKAKTSSSTAATTSHPTPPSSEHHAIDLFLESSLLKQIQIQTRYPSYQKYQLSRFSGYSSITRETIQLELQEIKKYQ